MLVTKAGLVGGVVDLCREVLAFRNHFGGHDSAGLTVVDLLVGEVLGGLVAGEGALGLVHKSRHCCRLGWLVGG